MSEYNRRRSIKLDKDIGDHGEEAVIEIVPGPHPYLWIGDEARCYGTVAGKEFRKLEAAFSTQAGKE